MSRKFLKIWRKVRRLVWTGAKEGKLRESSPFYTQINSGWQTSCEFAVQDWLELWASSVLGPSRNLHCPARSFPAFNQLGKDWQSLLDSCVMLKTSCSGLLSFSPLLPLERSSSRSQQRHLSRIRHVSMTLQNLPRLHFSCFEIGKIELQKLTCFIASCLVSERWRRISLSSHFCVLVMNEWSINYVSIPRSHDLWNQTKFQR